MHLSTYSPKEARNNLSLLFFFLFLKAMFMVGVVLFAHIHLGPDEAQYWTWSQNLDWGYYSKPPGIAWEIWLGTLFFGNTELGVRFFAIIVGFFLALSVYRLSLTSGLQPKVCFWAAIIMAFTPLGFLSSLFATTDAPFVLFWTLACSVICSALKNHETPHYLLLGFFILLGALFKWPIYLLWIIVLGLLLFIPYFRHIKVLAGMALSLLGLFPTFIWNSSRSWPTFKHVWTIIQGGPKPEGVVSQASKSNFFDFIGAQSALLSPILFFVLLLAFVYLIRNRKKISAPLLFCGFLSLSLLSGYSIAALFQKMQGNWAVYAYPTAIVFLSWFLCEKMNRRWLFIGIGSSFSLIAIVLAIPTIQEKSLFKKFEVPFKLNPFKECLGWDRISQSLHEAGYQPSENFLFADRYQMCSILSFYSPDQKRAYFFNIGKSRKNQFSFWPSMAKEKGLTGFFVFITYTPRLEQNANQIHKTKVLLSDYFSSVEVADIYPLYYSNGKPVKSAILLKCTNYNGETPKDPDLW